MKHQKQLLTVLLMSEPSLYATGTAQRDAARKELEIQ